MPERTPMYSENSQAEVAPGEDLMDLDFTRKAEASPEEIAQTEKDEAAQVAAKEALEKSYDWDNANQRRAGFN